MPSVSSEMLGNVENVNNIQYQSNSTWATSMSPPSVFRPPPPARNSRVKYSPQEYFADPRKIPPPPAIRSPVLATKSRSYFMRLCLVIISLAVILSCVQLITTYRHCHSKIASLAAESRDENQHVEAFSAFVKANADILGTGKQMHEDTVDDIILLRHEDGDSSNDFTRFQTLRRRRRAFRRERERIQRSPQSAQQQNLGHSSWSGNSLSNTDYQERLRNDGLTDSEFSEMMILRQTLLRSPKTQGHHESNNEAKRSAVIELQRHEPPTPPIQRNFPLPLPPNATENAAELKRLRLIRELLQQNKSTLAPSIFKPAIGYEARPFGRRRRDLAALPDNRNCVPRKRFESLPNFTRRDEKVRPKYAVVSLVVRSSAHNADNTTRRSIMHELTFLNKLQYCKLHGYDFILEDESVIDTSRPPHWSKIRVLRKWLPFYEWIVWVDMDVIFTNWERKIEHLVQDELTRHLLQDLQQQEVAAAQTRSFGRVPAKRRYIDFVRSLQRGRSQLDADKQFPATSEGVSWMKRNGILNDRNEYGEAAVALFLNTTSQDSMPEFKMKQIDLILTHDQNGWNSGVMFFRNSWWTHNFLRRVWAVPASLTKPYFDQGAFIYLLTPGFRGRDVDQAEIDRNHLWDTDDNTFNANHENFIFRESDMAHRWLEGDWVMHLASCKSYSYCLDTIKAFCEEAMCRNPLALDPPKKEAGNWTAPTRFTPPDGSVVSLPSLTEELWDVSHLTAQARGVYLARPDVNEENDFGGQFDNSGVSNHLHEEFKKIAEVLVGSVSPLTSERHVTGRRHANWRRNYYNNNNNNNRVLEAVDALAVPPPMQLP